MSKIKQTISKRIMSCFLIIAMLMTLLPAIQVYAEDSNSRMYTYDNYSIEYTVNSSWGNSQSIRVKLTNTGTEPILNWAVKYNVGGTISELSNAAVFKQTDQVYTLKNVGYNYEIQPNQNVIFTYTVTGEDLAIPDNMKLVSKRIQKQNGFDVQYSADDWGTGFQAGVTITNSTDQPIEAWTLTFDGNFSVGNLWNARIISSSGNIYTVASQSWTNPIPANSTLSFSFTGTKEVGEEVVLDGFVLTEVVVSVIDWEDTTDSDNDGLPDVYEINVCQTDPNNPDTDGDGLPDGFELLISYTDPTVKDSDGNGITDDAEDFDTDDLSNYQEFLLGTDPYNADTDNDGLLDGDEVNIYETDPLKSDTDEDGINDGDEPEIGLDPLNPQTFGVPDSQYTFLQDINAEKLEEINKDNLYNVEISINAAGNANKIMEINESPYTNSLQNNDAILGKIIEIKYDDNLKVDSATVKFTIPENNIGTPTGMYDDPGLAGVQRFQIFKYDTESNLMYPVQTEFDTVHNTLTVTTEELGNYMILDMDKWMYNLGITPAPSEIPLAVMSNAPESAVQPDTMPEGISAEEPKEPEELPVNYDEIMREQIENALGTNTVLFNAAPGTLSELPDYNKQIDVVFAIDTSGSMSGTINTCKQKIASLVSDLYNAGITANIGIVTFGDYRQENIIQTVDGLVWAKTPQQASGLISKVNLYAWGLENHLDAMETIMSMPFRSNALKFAVLITDEPITLNDNNCYRDNQINTNDIANELSERGIITSVVSHNPSTFEPLYEETEGIQTSVYGDFPAYLYAFITGYLQNNKTYTYIGANDLCTRTLKAPIAKNGDTDSDGDSLTDWDETDKEAIEFFAETYYQDGDVISVPTFAQYMSYCNFYVATQFNRLNQHYSDEIAMLRILPIVSDPMNADGDGDWIKDNVDTKPLKGNPNNISADLSPDLIEQLQNWLVSLGYLNMLDNPYGVSYGVLTHNAVNVYRLNHGITLTEEKTLDNKTFAMIANDYFNKFGNGEDDYYSILLHNATSYTNGNIPIVRPALSQEYTNQGITVSLETNKTIKSSINKNGGSVPTISLYFYDYTEPINRMLVRNADFAQVKTDKKSYPSKLAWFYFMVNHEEEWDIKLENRWNEQLPDIKYYAQKFPFVYKQNVMNSEDLGNINYGYCGYAVGFNDQELYAGSKLAGITGSSPDTLEDKAYILLGMILYCNDYGVKFIPAD